MYRVNVPVRDASLGTLLIDAMYTTGLVPGSEEFIEKIKAVMQDPD